MIGNKRVLAIVPARGGSKGVKLKNIRKLNDIPLIGWVAKVINNISYIDRSVVSTDHNDIASIAEQYGLSVPFRRPDSLSGDMIGDADVLTHALVEMEKLDGVIYDIIIMLQPTSPMRKVSHIKDSIELFVEEGADSLWTLSETDSKGHPFKQHLINNGEIDYYDQNAVNIVARQQLSTTYHKNGVAYIISRHCLLNKKSIKGDKCIPYIIDDIVINIDTEFDLDMAQFFMSKYGVEEYSKG